MRTGHQWADAYIIIIVLSCEAEHFEIFHSCQEVLIWIYFEFLTSNPPDLTKSAWTIVTNGQWPYRPKDRQLLEDRGPNSNWSSAPQGGPSNSLGPKWRPPLSIHPHPCPKLPHISRAGNGMVATLWPVIEAQGIIGHATAATVMPPPALPYKMHTDAPAKTVIRGLDW